MSNTNIQPTAQIAPLAQLSADVEVGHYAVIGPEVKIDSGCQIGDHCVITGKTTIGKNCRIFTGAVLGSIPQDLKYNDEKTGLIVGDNNTIREYVTINLGTVASGKTVVGDNNLIMAYAHIAHDCIIGNHVIIANVGTLAGHIVVEDQAIIGGLAAIHQFVRVGTLSIIGGCSKVNQDVPPYSMCDGNPIKARALNKIGLNRAAVDKEIRRNLKQAFTILFNSGLTILHALEKIEAEVPMTTELTHLINFVKNSKRGICR